MKFGLLISIILCFLNNAIAQGNRDNYVQELEAAANIEDKVQALKQLASTYRTSNPNAIKMYAEEFITMSKGDTASLTFAWGHYYLGDYYTVIDEYEKAIPYLDQAFLSFNGSYYLDGIGETAYSLANIYFQVDQYRNALLYGQTALDTFYKTGNLLKQANTLSLLCDILTYMERYNQAIQYCVRSMNIKEEISIEAGKEVTLNTIGLIYQELGTYQKAKEYLNQALSLSIRNNDPYNIATTYSNLGNLYLLLNNIDSALYFFREAMKIDEAAADKVGLAYSHFDIGMLYKSIDKLSLAEQSLLEANKIAEELNMPELIAKIKIGLAELSTVRGSYQNSVNMLKGSLVIAQRINSSSILRDVYQNLSKTYDKMGDKDNSLVYMRLYMLEAERKYKNDNARAIAEIETIYGIEQKEKEIDLLQKEKAIEALKAEQRWFLMISGAAGLLFLLILLGILYNRNKLKSKINARLRLQNNEILEQKEEIETQKEELEEKKNSLSIKNDMITDSIHYAKQIQESLLPAKAVLKHLLPKSFIYYKPKDIVSGDFYWHATINDKVAVAVIDCTGHGVPGAFMTVLANTLLNQIILETGIHSPDLVISLLDQKIKQTLHQNDLNSSNMDGLDIGLIFIDRVNQTLQFAGAKIPLYIVADGELQIVKADRYSVGSSQLQEKIFTKKNIALTRGSMLYLSSDGYQDQFGGLKDKKFMKKNFYQFLQSISMLPPFEQEHALETKHQHWRGSVPQTDDILVIGIKV